MEDRINFDKEGKKKAILVVILMLSLSIWVTLDAKIFIRNFLIKEWHIILIGVFAMIFFSALLYSLIKVLPRTCALIISEEYLIDNSRYEAIGKIRWDEISKISKIKKNAIQIFLKKGVSERGDNNLLKKFLRWSLNWDYKNSIIISSAALECDIDYLEKKIMQAYKKAKKSGSTRPSSPSPKSSK